jgi:ABC-type transporter Mla subunit MlaD
VNETMRDFVIGLCAIVAIIGLSVLLVRFGEIQTTNKYTIEIPSMTASGLRTGSSVTLNGVKIGIIESVTNTANPRWPVRIALGIDEGYEVPSTAIPYATSSLLGTGSTLELSVDPSDRTAPPLATDGSAQLQGPVRNLMLTKLNEALDERLQPVLASVQLLSETYTELGDELIAMVGDSDEPIDGPTIRSTLARIDGALHLVELWLDNDEARASMHDLMATGIVFVNEGIDLVNELTKLAANVDVRSEQFMDELVPVASELARMLDTADRLLEAIRDGDGTLGQLVKNPDLYNSIEASMKQLEEAIISFTLMIDQIREEGIF